MTPKSNLCCRISLVIAVLLVCAVVLTAGAPSSFAAGPTQTLARGSGKGVRVSMPGYKPGEVIVVWKEGASAEKKDAVKSDVGVKRSLSNAWVAEKTGREVLKLRPGTSEKDALRALRRDPSVQAAGLNLLKQLDYTPSSPDFVNQWGLNNTGQTIEGQAGTPDADIDAVEAWNLETGNTNPTTVAVIDSGIDLGHPNLSGRLWTNNADPVNGVDDDGNGYIDDNHGYNFAGISNYGATWAWAFGMDSASQYVAQQFTAQGTNGQCRIAGLEMWFYGKVGNPTQTIRYAVRSSLSGGNIAVTNPISPDRIDASNPGTYVYEPFTSVANLTPGNTYYFVAYTSSVDTDNFYSIVDHVADDDANWDCYLEGSEWWNFNGTWTEFPADDFYFKSSGYYYNRDNNGHGTHCCGIVGAADSGSGSVGVAFGDQTRLMALKAGDSSGSLWSSDWMDAIDYARTMGADTISMSFGGTGADAAEQAVITNACNSGLSIFASSGNTYDTVMQYPVGYDNVIGVGATDNQDVVASFSTHNSSVDISAPGVDYYSTMPTYAVAMNSLPAAYGGPFAQNYDYMSGTSMACPTAAGLGALIRSANPALTPAQVQSLIESTADDKGGAGRDDYYGYGRINAWGAVNNIPSNPVPTITGLSPDSKAADSASFTLTVDGTNMLYNSTVRWNGADRITTYVSPTRLTASIPADDIATAGTAGVTVFNPAPGGGTSGAKTFTIKSPSSTWYLAEGTTNWGFDTYISIANPNPSALTAHITYMLKGGATMVQNVNLPAYSQTKVNPRDTVGDRDFSTRVVSSDLTKPIAVDRTMSWMGDGAASPEAHSSVGVNSADTTWYMPEGSTNYGFETWLCIQNPNAGKATCTFTYMIEGEDPVTRVKEVPGNSRETYNMAEDIGNKDASIRVTSNIPVIPERSMYRNNRREGHESIGATTSAASYYLAEGTTNYGFTTYVCVQNPNPNPITVDITFMTGDGPRSHPQNPIPMAANSRKTIRVNDVLPDTDFSTQVTGSKPIIAERAMYWDNGTGEACHDSIGMSEPHYNFYLPDGQTSDGIQTYICVQNPSSYEGPVRITYLKAGGGAPVVFEVTIPGNSRKTYDMADKIPSGRASVMVESLHGAHKYMVERVMYWNDRGAGTATIGGYSDTGF